MSSDLANFHLVLFARISRLDSATTTQTTALGAALAAPGTTNVSAPAADATKVLGTTNNLFSGGTSLFGSQIQPNQGTFGNLGLATNNFNAITPTSAATASALGLGSIRPSTSTRRNGSSSTSTRFAGSTWDLTRTTRRATDCTLCPCRSRSLPASALTRVRRRPWVSVEHEFKVPTSSLRRSRTWWSTT